MPALLPTQVNQPAASRRLLTAVALAAVLACTVLLLQWGHLQGSVQHSPVPRKLKEDCRESFPASLGRPPIRGLTPARLGLQHKKWVQDWVMKDVPSLVRTPRRQLSLELGVGAIVGGVEGDFVETGVAAGGTAILLAKVLEEYDKGGNRLLWAADSFDGLPPPGEEDTMGGMIVGARGYYNYSQEVFVSNLEGFGVQMNRVKMLKGWFNETLAQAGIERIAYLRLDGDLYDSTMDALEALYSKVSPGGFVYVDDYGSYNGCKIAVDRFRSEHGIDGPLHYQAVPENVYASPGNQSGWEAVWWMKGW